MVRRRRRESGERSGHRLRARASSLRFDASSTCRTSSSCRSRTTTSSSGRACRASRSAARCRGRSPAPRRSSPPAAPTVVRQAIEARRRGRSSSARRAGSGSVVPAVSFVIPSETARAVVPEPAECDAVFSPYETDVPYSNHHVVESPFGVTWPRSVAVVTAIGVASAVTTIGAELVLNVASAAGRRPGVARRDDPEVVGLADLELGDRDRLVLRARARAGALDRGLRAVARRRAVLEVEGGVAAVRVDRPVQRRRGRADAGRRSGDRAGRSERREHRVAAVRRAGAVRRDDAVVVRRAGLQARRGWR